MSWKGIETGTTIKDGKQGLAEHTPHSGQRAELAGVPAVRVRRVRRRNPTDTIGVATDTSLSPAEYGATLAMLRRSLQHSIKRGKRAKEQQLDVWGVDAPFHEVGEHGSYDHYFGPLLQEAGAESFQGLLQERKQQGLATHTLDLFGGGYFIDDVTIPQSITGVRLLDSSEEMVRQLDFMATYHESVDVKGRAQRAIERVRRVISSPKWSVVTGNLFSPTTWHKLDTDRTNRSIGAYDLIVIKPERAIDDKEIFHGKDRPQNNDQVNSMYALKYLRLLNQAYTRLSSQSGMLFTEVPEFIAENYLDTFREQLAAGGIQTEVMDSLYWTGRKNLRLTKQPGSAPDLEQLV